VKHLNNIGIALRKFHDKEQWNLSRNVWEKYLLIAWKQTFPGAEIKRDTDFFELVGNGSTALMGIRMRKYLEKVSKREFPLFLLFENPTIEELSLALSKWQIKEGKWSNLVMIREGCQDYPLFCFHAIEGNSIWYREMAETLPQGQRVYGLEAPGLDKRQIPCFSMEELASRHIREIKKVQHAGPYFLAGYSFGGLVAFEVARQLECSGDTVGSLAIIDRSSPLAARKRFFGLVCPVELTFEKGRSLVGRFRCHWYWTSKWIRTGFRKRIAFLMVSRGLRVPFMRKIMRDTSHFIMMFYKPKTLYKGPMLLLRQRIKKNERSLVHERFLREDYGWSEYIKGNITVRYIPGPDHKSVMNRPYSYNLASLIQGARPVYPVNPPKDSKLL